MDIGVHREQKLNPAGSWDKQICRQIQDRSNIIFALITRSCLYVTGDVFWRWIYKLLLHWYTMFGLQIQKLRMSRQLPFNFQLLPRRQVCISHDVIKAIYGLIVACCFGWVMHYPLLFPFKKLFKITGNTERAFKLDSSFFEGNKTRGIFISKVSGKDRKQKETSSRKRVTRKLLCGASAEQWYGFQLGPAIVLICFKLSKCGARAV